MSNNELERTIAKLRAEYAEQLPVTVGQIEDGWRQLVAAETGAATFADLARKAHGIAGSGTTFGLPEASRAGRDLEDILDRLAESGRLPDAAEQDRVSALLAALRRAAAER